MLTPSGRFLISLVRCGLHHAAQRLNLGGGDVTRHLATLLCRQGRYLSTTAELELAREIKEQVLFGTDRGKPQGHRGR